jgi:hypothetical protein
MGAPDDYRIVVRATRNVTNAGFAPNTNSRIGHTVVVPLRAGR